MHPGNVAATDVPHYMVAHFRFLETIDRDFAGGLDMHLILDNGSSHVAKPQRVAGR